MFFPQIWLENKHLLKRLENRLADERVVSVSIIIITGLFAFIPNLNKIGIRADDWRIFSNFHFFDGDLFPFRPLLGITLNGILTITGLNLRVLYPLLIGTHILSVIILYFTLRRLLPVQPTIVLIISVLFMVYPSDYTHTWLTMIASHIKNILLFTAIWLYLSFISDTTKFISWFIGMLLFIITFGISELHFGLIAFLPIFGLKKIRTGIITAIEVIFPVLICLVYIYWRFFIYSGPDYTKYPIDWLAFIKELPGKLLLGYKCVLVYAWTAPIRGILGNFASSWKVLAVIILPAIFGLLTYKIVNLPFRNGLKFAIGYGSEKNKKAIIRLLVWIFYAFILVGLGFLPYLPVGNIWIGGDSGRMTSYAAIGASILLTLTVYSFSLIIGKRSTCARHFTVAILFPYIITAVFYQWCAQQGMITTWIQQRRMWSELLRLVPSVQPETCIYIINVPEVKGIWEYSPLVLPGEITGAVRLLYNDPSLCGGVFSRDESKIFGDDGVKFFSDGIKPRFSVNRIPYEQVLMMEYKYEGCLELLTRVPEQLIVDYSRPIHLTMNRIRSFLADDTFHYLIEPRIACSIPNN